MLRIYTPGCQFCHCPLPSALLLSNAGVEVQRRQQHLPLNQTNFAVPRDPAASALLIEPPVQSDGRTLHLVSSVADYATYQDGLGGTGGDLRPILFRSPGS